MDEKQEINGAGSLVSLARREIEKRKAEPRLLLFDATMLALGALLSRVHIVLGAYPLGPAILAASPVGVPVLLAGAVVGAISLGRDGIILAAVALITVLMRLLISGSGGAGCALFREPLLLRASSAVIASFVGAVYLFIAEWITPSVLLSGLASCALAALFTLIFSMLYVTDVGFFDMLFGEGAVLSRARRGKEKHLEYAFEVSLGVLFAIVSYSLRDASFLGIDPSFVFSALVALFFAKRFGAVRAAAMGFASSVLVSGTSSVALALFGLVAGLAFPFGLSLAVAAGGAAALGWCAYTGGVVELLSLMPELAVASAFFFPFSKAFSKEKAGAEELARAAHDMAAEAVLSHRDDPGGELERLGTALAAVSDALSSHDRAGRGEFARELRERLVLILRDSCALCPHFEVCRAINPAPCVEILGALAELAIREKHLPESARALLPGYCQAKDALIGRLGYETAAFFREHAGESRADELSREYSLVTRLLEEARDAEERERRDDEELSERLTPILSKFGLEGGSVRVIGDRRMRLIYAGRDPSGEHIASPELKAALEGELGLTLSPPSFFRRGELVLMDSPTAEKYAAKAASRVEAKSAEEGSGDVLLSFTSPDGYFYSVISDGMGTGESAREIARLAADVLRAMLTASVSDNTALHVLNRVIRGCRGERSVALDIFRYDLKRGEGVFIKSGAAISYVKRGDSLFRIRSETAPLGLMQKIDAERVKIDVRPGDVIIMMSDGVAEANEAALYNVISRGAESPAELAEELIREARRSGVCDDMSVQIIELKNAV